MKRASSIPRLNKEVVLQAHKLSDAEARFLVAEYYQIQDIRKRTDMQIRHLGDREMPALLMYAADSAAHIESQIFRGLEAYAENHLIGRWMMSIDGVGPVISAGLIAYTGGPVEAVKSDDGKPQVGKDGKIVTKPVFTVGHWWRLAGLDPSSKWEKGHKRPWSANLKQICWHAGQSFKRVSSNPDAFYGQIYRERKKLVVMRNERGDYAERAKTYFTKEASVRKLLATGKLPPSNLDSQACRFAAKMFLAHLHAVWFWHHFNEPPPRPYAIDRLHHADWIRVPNSDQFPGFDAAYYNQGTAKKNVA
jgi:hypothetical protein